MTAALSLDDEHQLLDVARAAAGAYLRRHPGLAHNADDILSDACFGAASAAGRHDPAGRASWRPFVAQRAVGAIADGVRDRAPLSRHEAKVAGDRATELAAARAPVPLEHLMDVGWEPAFVDAGFEQLEVAEDLAEIRDRVLELVDLCPPAEAVALLALVGYQLPGDEVAERLGVALTTVYRFKALALRRIRAHLAAPDRPRPRATYPRRSFRELHDAVLTPSGSPPMTTTTPLLVPSTDQIIANLFLTGHGLDVVAERGLANGWTRADAQRVVEAHGWKLDATGRLPRDQQRAPVPGPTPAVAVNGGAPIDRIKDKIAVALKHDSPDIRRKAQAANEALARLDTALTEWGTKQAARERIAELERALAQAKAKLHGPRKPSTTAPAGEAAQARAWAQKNGVDCPARGRVPQTVLDAWREATAKKPASGQ